MNGSALTQDQMNSIARNQADKLRFVRQAIVPIQMPQGLVKNIPGHRVNRNESLSIQANQTLQPLQMSRHFFLYGEQAGDADVLTTAIEFAAADMAQAEDAVLLLGSRAKETLDSLHVKLSTPEELGVQEGLLGTDDEEVPPEQVLDSILQGIKTLQERQQAGDYHVIVSPVLHQSAYANQKTPMDAPIYQIQPRLATNGFLYSEAISGSRGVIFSLARNTIKLAIPMDIHVEQLPDDDDSRPRYRVAQQFRLVIDDPRALVALKPVARTNATDKTASPERA